MRFRYKWEWFKCVSMFSCDCFCVLFGWIGEKTQLCWLLFQTICNRNTNTHAPQTARWIEKCFECEKERSKIHRAKKRKVKLNANICACMYEAINLSFRCFRCFCVYKKLLFLSTVDQNSVLNERQMLKISWIFFICISLSQSYLERINVCL